MAGHKTETQKVQGELGALIRMYKDTKTAEDTHDLIQGLVCTRGLESMWTLMNSFMRIPEIKTQIDAGLLTVIGFCSGKTLEDGSEIPSCTVNGNILDPNDKEENKKKVWEKVFALADSKRDFVIFHCQMLGVGTDLPSLNSVLILGDKNETDLFQSIMRGCRVDYNNPEKTAYHVFIYVDSETKSYMRKFIETLDKLGGPELIKAFSNDVNQGSCQPGENPLFCQILASYTSSTEVIEEYNQIVNCGEYLKHAANEAIVKKMMAYLDSGELDKYEQMREMWFGYQEKNAG